MKKRTNSCMIDLESLKQKLSTKSEFDGWTLAQKTKLNDRHTRVLLLQAYPKTFSLQMIYNFLSIYGGISRIVKIEGKLYIEFSTAKAKKIVSEIFNGQNFGELRFQFVDKVKELMIEESVINSEDVIVKGDLTIGKTFLLVNPKASRSSNEKTNNEQNLPSSVVVFLNSHIDAVKLKQFLKDNGDYQMKIQT